MSIANEEKNMLQGQNGQEHQLIWYKEVLYKIEKKKLILWKW